MIKRGEVEAAGAATYVAKTLSDYARRHGASVEELREAINRAMERAPDFADQWMQEVFAGEEHKVLRRPPH